MRFTTKKSTLLVAFLLMLYIGPSLIAVSYASPAIPTQPNMTKEFSLSSGESWYDEDWTRRNGISITGGGGAGTDYQVNLIITYDSDMQADFDDIRFTDDDGKTLLDYWLEIKIDSINANFWVEVKDTLSVAGLIYMYYGNSEVTTTSNGTNTFLFFDDFENNNMNRWDKVGAYWSTVSDRVNGLGGTYSGFGDAGASSADRWLHTNSPYTKGYNTSNFAMHMWVNTQVETSKEYLFRCSNNTIAYAYGLVGDQNDWYYDNGEYIMWEANTYLDDTWFEVDLVFDWTNDLYRLWIDDVSKGTADLEDISGTDITNIDSWEIVVDSGAGEDMWIDDCYTRKWVLTEPAFDAFLGEENYETWDHWREVGSVELIFTMPLDETGLNILLIFLGLIMIPTSTIYAAKGGLKEASTNKLFYFLIVFVLGWGLFLGGIFG